MSNSPSPTHDSEDWLYVVLREMYQTVAQDVDGVHIGRKGYRLRPEEVPKAYAEEIRSRFSHYLKPEDVERQTREAYELGRNYEANRRDYGDRHPYTEANQLSTLNREKQQLDKGE